MGAPKIIRFMIVSKGNKRLHSTFWGLFLTSLTQLKSSYFTYGTNSNKAGMIDHMIENRCVGKSNILIVS